MRLPAKVSFGLSLFLAARTGVATRSPDIGGCGVALNLIREGDHGPTIIDPAAPQLLTRFRVATGDQHRRDARRVDPAPVTVR